MITEIDAADYLTLAAAWKLDQGHGRQSRNFPGQAVRLRNAIPRGRFRRCKSMAAWG